MPRPKRWFHVSQDINFDPEFELLCKNFGLGGVRLFLQVMSILDKTDNHWSLHKDFDLNVLARSCGTKPKIILGSCQLLIDMKWISVGVDEEMNQFIFARNYLKYRGTRVHENDMTKHVSSSPPSLPFPSLNKETHTREKNNNKKTPKSEQRRAPSLQFVNFWSCFPLRDGKRLGRGETEKLFSALSRDDQLLAIQAARNFAVSRGVKRGIGIMDPKRFLKNGNGSQPWRDWIEPEASSKANSSGTCSGRIEVGSKYKQCGKTPTKIIGKNSVCDDCHAAHLKEQLAIIGKDRSDAK